ncbi:MAG: DUF2975 domain-containing protein [Ignavibacteriales bacterium]
MKKSRIAQFVSIILKLMLVLGVASLFFLPTLYDTFSGIQETTFNEQTIYYRVAFYMCAIGGLTIVYCLIKVFKNVYNGSPFKKETVINLKAIAILFMILSIIIAIKIIFIPSIISISVLLVTFMASLSFYVLSQVFKVAIEYKDEIDQTV